MAAVLLACLSAALFGAMAVAIRVALRRADDPEVGALATSSIALAVTGVVGLVAAPGDLDPGELWPFLVAGAIAPGTSQILFVHAVRKAGAARTAVLMGTAPLATAPVSLLAGAATIGLYLVISRRGRRFAGYGRAVRAFGASGLLFGLSYSALFEAYYRGRVSVVAPLVATESLWGVVFSVLLLRRSELVGRRLVLGATLIVAGGALIGAWR